MPAIVRESVYKHHDNCEKKVYVHWINRNLFNKESLTPSLPMNHNSEEIFDQINNGVLYCETLNEIFPNSIDISVLVIGPETQNEEKFKNLQLAFETARSYGCQVDNLRTKDVFCGVRQSVLELFWQLFYVGLVVSINYENFPEIAMLKEDDESRNVITEMKPEEILIRYVNFQIRLYNPMGKVMKSYKDLGDGYVYAQLIDSLAQARHITLKNYTSIILKEKNDRSRYEMIFENFDCIKVQGFLLEELMFTNCSEAASYKMHLLTTAIFFHKFGIVTPTTRSTASTEYEVTYKKVERETNGEKLCRNFLNFICVKPVVTNLVNDCKDGLIFAQVMKLFSPDIFRRDSFIEEFDDEQIESKRIHNMAIIKNRFDKFHHIPILEFHPEWMQGGNKRIVCAVVYNLMIHWALNIGRADENVTEANMSNVYSENLYIPFDKNENNYVELSNKKFSEKDLLAWVNSLSSDYNLLSFRDNQIQDRNVLARAIDALIPGCIDWEYFNSLGSRKERSLYSVNIARREGFPMFINPNMISSGDYRSTLMAFLILKERQPKSKRKPCEDI